MNIEAKTLAKYEQINFNDISKGLFTMTKWDLFQEYKFNIKPIIVTLINITSH